MELDDLSAIELKRLIYEETMRFFNSQAESDAMQEAL